MRVLKYMAMLWGLSFMACQPNEPDSVSDMTPGGTPGTRPSTQEPASSPDNLIEKTLKSSVKVSSSYSDYFHTITIRSTAHTLLSDHHIDFGIGHDRESFPNNRFSFGMKGLGEYYTDYLAEDTLVVIIRAPFWNLYSQVSDFTDFSKKIICEDAYESNDISTLSKYEEEGMKYHPFPAAMIDNSLVVDLSTPAIGGEHLAHPKQ